MKLVRTITSDEQHDAAIASGSIGAAWGKSLGAQTAIDLGVGGRLRWLRFDHCMDAARP